MRTIAAVKGIQNLSPEELVALSIAAEEIKTDVDYLAAVISFETAGTFRPDIENRAGSGAVGLIQFMPTTARSLGTDIIKLRNMSFEEQLGFVVKYFEWYNQHNLNSLHALYLAVFWPVAIDKEDSYVVASKEGPHAIAYIQNRGFDKDAKGFFTRGDICKALDNIMSAADLFPRIDINDVKCEESGENNV